MPPIPELEAIRKAQILEAGLTCLTQNGIAKTTLDDVCRAAGLSKGGLVHYYKSKRLLFRAVFEEFFKRIFQRGADTMATFDTPLEQILSYDWLYDENNLEAYLGYPLLLDLLALAAHDDEFLPMMQSWIGNWVTLLGNALEQGVKQGTFKPMDVRQVAQSISAIYQGIATRWYLGGDSHSSAWAIDTYHKGIMGVLSPYLA
jgi:AcrR family transcriptional regulator